MRCILLLWCKNVSIFSKPFCDDELLTYLVFFEFFASPIAHTNSAFLNDVLFRQMYIITICHWSTDQLNLFIETLNVENDHAPHLRYLVIYNIFFLWLLWLEVKSFRIWLNFKKNIGKIKGFSHLNNLFHFPKWWI
jgi:hypothetical protein